MIYAMQKHNAAPPKICEKIGMQIKGIILKSIEILIQ